MIHDAATYLSGYDTQLASIYPTGISIVLPDEDVLKYFDIDIRGIYMNSSYRSFAKDFGDGSYRDMFGVIPANQVRINR